MKELFSYKSRVYQNLINFDNKNGICVLCSIANLKSTTKETVSPLTCCINGLPGWQVRFWLEWKWTYVALVGLIYLKAHRRIVYGATLDNVPYGGCPETPQSRLDVYVGSLFTNFYCHSRRSRGLFQHMRRMNKRKYENLVFPYGGLHVNSLCLACFV